MCVVRNGSHGSHCCHICRTSGGWSIEPVASLNQKAQRLIIRQLRTPLAQGELT